MTLKILALTGGLAGCKENPTPDPKTSTQNASPPPNRSWKNTIDRIWLGAEYWANPMEDWRIKGGWAECTTSGSNRSIHHLTHQITDPAKPFSMSVRAGLRVPLQKDNGAGFRIGLRSDINEFRSNCFAKGGINAGAAGNTLFLGSKKLALDAPLDWSKDVILDLQGKAAGDSYELTLTAKNSEGTEIGTVQTTVPRDRILGNVALVSQFQGPPKRNEATGFRFTEWEVKGDAFTVSPKQEFGPILWSMYTLSDSRSDEGFILKLSALTGPLGEGHNQQVELQVEHDGDWKSMGDAQLDPDAWAATFRIPNWTETKAVPYRLVYREKHLDESESTGEWTGVIRANPTGRPLRLAALTCQNDYAFPYEPVANNVVNLDPDMLYFSGDQLYESHGGFGIIREPAAPAILNYLRKFYQFGWAFREAMRNAPTVCIPDDHDVFQGNIWGEGGAAMKDLDKGASSKGGYREPARMVNAVHRTNTAHHPDPFDPDPCAQDISVYYTDLVYGNVSFAIIGDRQWKSGPEHVDTGSGRADHVPDPDFDTSVLDKPDLVLLGERQEQFLKKWSKDWRGHEMKILLSQTVFSGLATHHGKTNGYLKADLDSGAWPQTARNRAIRIIRESMALHINGDQHLSSLSQYGADKQRDSNWAFCTPAIAAGYPRWWRPDELGMAHQNRPNHGLENTGEFLDGLGNFTYVYAVGNPIVPTAKNRYEKAHQKGSGFGLVTVDTKAKTYFVEAFRFSVDAKVDNPENQFPGWPVLIHQQENKGENKIG